MMFSVRLVSLREQIDVEFAVSKKFGFRLAYWKTYNHKQVPAHSIISPGSHLREPGEDFIIAWPLSRAASHFSPRNRLSEVPSASRRDSRSDNGSRPRRERSQPHR